MAEMTTLTLTQEFCRRQGLPQPSAVTSSLDDTVQQILGLLNEGIMDLADRYEWQQLITRFSFVHANGTDYLAQDFASVCPGFKAMLNRTLWDTTGKTELAGPLSEIEWEQVTNMLSASSRYSYRLNFDKLYIFPVPATPASITFRFTWLTRYGVLASTTPVETYTTDTATPRLPSYIVLQDLKWRWRQSKGLPYAEDQRQCEQMIVNAIAREPQATLILDGGVERGLGAGPGLLIPAGSWNL